MGLPMARRLCQAGFSVHAYNRSIDKAQALLPFGAVVHATAAQAVAQADVTISMLESGAVVSDVLFGHGAAAHAMPRGSLFIDMASIKPREARAHADALAALGVAHVDCPVSGGTGGAEGGTLVMMAGGQLADFERALPILKSFGRATHVGPHGAGQLAKLANQMIVGGTIGIVAEALLLCERGGADMGKVREAIAGGFADSRILAVHGERMVKRDFAPRARVDIQLKDMRNALDNAGETAMALPILQLLEQLYAQASEHGHGNLDHSGLFVELAQRNAMQ